MAASIARLYADLFLRNKQFLAGLDESARAAQTKARAIGKSLTSIGGSLTTKATLPIVGAFGFAVNAASDLNETLSKTEAIFGENAKAVKVWGDTAATSVGLSKQAALEAASTVGNLLKGVGVANKDLPQFSENIVQAAADLGSFNNVDPAQVVEDLRSGLVGESEPLRKYGILLNEAAVKAEAMRLGLADANGELTEGAKVQARYSLIMKQIGNAQGDFARTSGGLANRLRIARAELANLAAEFGEVLLPYVLQAVKLFERWMLRFKELSPRQKGFIVAILAIVAALGPLLIVFGQIAIAVSALIPLLTLLLGPLGLVIAAIALFALAYSKNWLHIRDITNKVVGWVIKQFLRLAAILKGRKSLHDAIKDLPAPLQKLAIALRRIIVLFDDLIHGRWSRLEGDFDRLGQTIGNFFKSIGLEHFGQELKKSFDLVSNIVRNVVELIDDVVHGRWSEVWTDLKNIAADAIRLLIQQYIQIGALLWDAITGIDWAGIGNWLLTKGGELVTWLWQGMTTVWAESVRPWLHERLEAIEKAIGNWYERAYGWGASLINGIWDAITGAWDRVITWLGNNLSADNIAAHIGNWYGAAFGWGMSLIAGMADGIASVWNTLVGWIDAIIGQLERIPAWLRPGSPSKTMRVYGMSAATGLALGIKAGMPALTRAVGGMNAALGATSRPGSPNLAVRAVSPNLAMNGGGMRSLGPVTINNHFPEGVTDPEALANLASKYTLRALRRESAGAA